MQENKQNMGNRKLLFCYALFLVIVISLPAKAAEWGQSPKHETRAVWLTTIGGLDWPRGYARTAEQAARQQQQLDNILDRLKVAGINTVLLQTRIRATTIYPSNYEPWDGCLSGIPGRSPGYDALEYAIEACHKRGMELHAWVVAIPIGKWNKTGCQQLRKRHPSMLKKIGDEGFMNPAYSKTADYITSLCQEITGRYDIDGIHLDYIRYPETWPKATSRSEAEQRRQHISRIVEKVCRGVKVLKPWVKMSCAPIGKHDDLSRFSSYGWNAYSRTYQEAQRWAKEGWMDQLYPMMYFKGNQFYPFLLDWIEHRQNCDIVSGLGGYMLDYREKDWPLETMIRQLNAIRQYGAGYAIFRTQHLLNNTKGLYDFIKKDWNKTPALPMVMQGYGYKLPNPVQQLSVVKTDSIDGLSWEIPDNQHHATACYYNLYASHHYPVDTRQAENLMITRSSQPFFTVRHQRDADPWYYAVTVIDRLGMESSACQEDPPTCLDIADKEQEKTTDNSWLSKHQPAYTGIAVVTSMEGTLVTTLRCRQGKADVTSLPDGTYILRTLEKKGVSHRLARFTIYKRKVRIIEKNDEHINVFIS